MIPQTPWIERSFTFQQPLGLVPATIERLRGVPARLTMLVAHHSEESLSVRPPDGSWSVKEHIGHLYDLDEIHDGRLDDFLVGEEMLRAADITNRRTSEAGYNGRNVAEILGLFGQRRIKFVKRLLAFGEADMVRAAIHPRLKTPMRMADMALFTAEHDEHHMVKISGLLNLL